MYVIFFSSFRWWRDGILQFNTTASCSILAHVDRVYFCRCLVVLLSYVYLLYYVCIAVFTLNAGLLATGQTSESPATGHLHTGFSWFPCA